MSDITSASRRPAAARLGESELRTAKLLFDAELAKRRLRVGDLQVRVVKRAVRAPQVPPRPIRFAQRARVKLGRPVFEEAFQAPLLAARRALLGSDAAAPPRFLIRVDEFPHYRSWEDPTAFGVGAYEVFHRILREAGVPYMVAVLPRVSRDPLNPDGRESRALDLEETAMLKRLGQDGVCLAMHGLDHRTRHASPRRHSELCGLSLADAAALLDRGCAELAAQGVAPKVFVPPYNRFDAAQLPLLASRFEVVCGGPELIGILGMQGTPRWWGQTVYLPAYSPFYGTAEQILPAVRGAVERQTGSWVPIVLHWEWEARGGWSALERLAQEIAPLAASWQSFLVAVGRSRERQDDFAGGREPLRERTAFDGGSA